jgi:hypothetical protein
MSAISLPDSIHSLEIFTIEPSDRTNIFYLCNDRMTKEMGIGVMDGGHPSRVPFDGMSSFCPPFSASKKHKNITPLSSSI